MARLVINIISDSAIISSGLGSIIGSMKLPSAELNLCRHSDTPYQFGRQTLFFIDALSIPSDDLRRLKAESAPDKVMIVGLYHTALPPKLTELFDTMLPIYAEESTVKGVVREFLDRKEAQFNKTSDELTPREKEIVVGVVKGLSNKEIATSLNVSVNTVMTHRRNIASKLQIHSPAGLTIYAIVSKLIRIEDV